MLWFDREKMQILVTVVDVVFAEGFICEWPQCPAEQTQDLLFANLELSALCAAPSKLSCWLADKAELLLS